MFEHVLERLVVLLLITLSCIVQPTAASDDCSLLHLEAVSVVLVIASLGIMFAVAFLLGRWRLQQSPRAHSSPAAQTGDPQPLTNVAVTVPATVGNAARQPPVSSQQSLVATHRKRNSFSRMERKASVTGANEELNSALAEAFKMIRTLRWDLAPEGIPMNEDEQVCVEMQMKFL